MDLYRRGRAELSGAENRTIHSLPDGRKITQRNILQSEMYHLRCRKRPALHRHSQTGRLMLRHSKQKGCLPLQRVWRYLDKNSVQRREALSAHRKRYVFQRRKRRLPKTTSPDSGSKHRGKQFSDRFSKLPLDNPLEEDYPYQHEQSKREVYLPIR